MPSAKEKLKSLEAPAASKLGLSGAIAVSSSLVWIVQAAVVANSLGALASGAAAALSPVAATSLFCLLGILRHGADAVAGHTAFAAAQQVVSRERLRVIERESLASPLDHTRPPSAEIATLVAGKLDLLLPYLTRYRIASIRVRILPLAIVLAVASVSWVAALILIVAGPLIPVFMALIGLAAQDASEKQLVETGSLNAMLLERLNALVDIRLLNAGSYVADDFQKSADTLRQRTMKVLQIAFLSSTVLELFSALGIAMVAVFCGFSLLGTITFGAYGTPLGISEAIFILLLAPDFFQPMRELANAWHDRASALAVAVELEAHEERTGLVMLGKGLRVEALAGVPEISWSNLASRGARDPTHCYPDGRIAAGERIAIVGPSGSGKSTFLAMIAGLLPADGGEIRVCGAILEDVNADAWRHHLAWVGQNPHFINASLRANIVMAGDRIDDAAIAVAVESASAGAVVTSMSRGLATRLGENGTGVSGGEGRRLTLARAFYAQANVILADEPTADLDAETAQLVSDSLLKLAAAGRTLVVATHDPTLIALMDRHIRLGEG